MIDKFNEGESKKIGTLMRIVDSFLPTTEEENDALILEARKKLAEVFTIDRLKNMNQHFLLAKMMPLLLSAETVLGYDMNEYVVTEDEQSPCYIRVFKLQLCDKSEIYVINIQEEAYDETH